MVDIKRISKNKSLNQLSIMILLTIMTQVFMLLKGSLVASKFGINTDLDAFNFASSIGSFAYSFIGSGISTVLMPNLADDNNRRSLNIFITVLYTGAFLLLIFMVVFRKSLITILSGSSDSYFITVASNIFIITLIAGFLNSFLGLVNGVLQYKGQFNRLKVATLFTSVLLFLILLFGGEISIYYYAIAILITTIINVTMNLYFLASSKFEYSINFDIRDNKFKEMVKLFIPTIIGEGIYRISIIIDTLISARLGSGQVSILNYSNTVIGMVNILFLGNITSFIYPRLINSSRNNQSQESLFNYIIFINAIMFLIVCLFFCLGKEAIGILYERGNFTEQNTNIVYICSSIYILSLPANGARDLIYKYFYINNNTKIPFYNSIIISILNISISVILSNYIGFYGIALGTVITSYISIIIIIFKFKNLFGFNYDKKEFLKENFKIVLVTLLSIIIFKVISNVIFSNNIMIQLVVNSVIISIAYILLLKYFNSKVINIKI